MDHMSNMQLLLHPITLSLLLLLFSPASASFGPDYEHGGHPRFVCYPLPVDADPACSPAAGPGAGPGGPGGPGHQNAPPSGWWGASEEAKATILHLRESLVQQKEMILDQRETIRELTAKLLVCEGLGRGAAPHDEHHGASAHSYHAGAPVHHAYTDNWHYGNRQGHHGNTNLIPDSPHYPSVGGQRSGGHGSDNQGTDKPVAQGDITSSPEQMERMLQALKDRLDNMQKRNTSLTYSNSLKELLQRKISKLEQQLHHSNGALGGPERHGDDHIHGEGKEHHDDHRSDEHDGEHKEGGDGDDHAGPRDDGHDDDHHEADGDHGNEAGGHSLVSHTDYRTPGKTGFHSSKLDSMLDQLHLAAAFSKRKPTSPDAFQVSFPMRSNYMYGRVKRTLLQEIFALTLCLWIRPGVGPGMGTPFSYSAPGQANELVLIEWGNNPMELLVNDKAVTLPLSLSDGKWHHVCVTWSTRDGQWEAYQDGVQRGAGNNLSPWHPLKPGGVFVLGQEQDTLGGRFDASQSFVGEMSEVHMWSHVLTPSDVYSLASCGSHLQGDVIAWSEGEVELHGGVSSYPFDPCH
ncbi:neuronal pentraxin-1 isoform X3 [Takifugu rubripes]|uniref:neuronal pentraxin-1 isoform X3 n=1 Tax=Takifugu rubripes TaxID=31033 RepID=UPI0011459E76|nr:neuronal pentraxin-1-like isoform X3 [Takifugu rubripes]